MSNKNAWIFGTALLLSLATGRAAADATTLSVGDDSVNVAGMGAMLEFPVTRGGDLNYDAYLPFRTQNGSAQAPADYASTAGTLRIPAGAASATIQVPVSSGSGADKTVQLLLDGAVGTGPMPVFASPGRFIGDNPLAIATADLNGDGRLDLLLARSSGPGQSDQLLLDIGSASRRFGIAANSRALVVGDLNGDGRPDVVVGSSSTGAVQVFINNIVPGSRGSIEFAIPASFAGGGDAVALGDINGDGKLDIVVGSHGGETVAVRLNRTPPRGALDFASAEVVTTVPCGASNLALADLNGDGRLDFAAVNRHSRNVCVALNQTAPGAVTPSFGATTFHNVSSGDDGPQALVLADFNQDGRPDLAAVGPMSENGRVSILFNQSTAGVLAFSDEQTVAGIGGSVLTAADLNGDGKPELIAGNVLLLNHTAPGALTPGFTALPTRTTGAVRAAADLDGDGRPELLTFSSRQEEDLDNNDVPTGTFTTIHEALVLTNTTPAPTAVFNLAPAQNFAVNAKPRSVAIGDLDGDGKPDVVVANDVSGDVSVLLSQGNGVYADAVHYSTGGGSCADSGVIGDVVIGDLNADGKPDLAAINCAGKIVTMSGNGDGTFATAVAYFTVSTIRIRQGELNGDGKPDLVALDFGNALLEALFNNGSGGFRQARTLFILARNPAGFDIADFNGDGRLDFAIIFVNQGLSVFLANSSGGFETPADYATGNNPSFVAAGDLNGDGKPDLAVGNLSNSNVSVLLNLGGGNFDAPLNFATGTGPSSVAIGDVNGDGRPDLVVANQNSNDVSMLLSTGSGTFAAPLTFTASTGPSSVAIGDVNGDGMPDVVVANSGSNNISVLLNTQYRAQLGDANATGTISYTPPAPTPTPAPAPLPAPTPEPTPSTGASGTTDVPVLSSSGQTFNYTTSAGTIMNLRAITPPESATAIAGVEYPAGFFAFEVALSGGATQTTISIELPPGVDANALVKCNAAGVCRRLENVTITTAGGITTLSYTLVDNSADDSDTRVGFISDPIGPANVATGGSGHNDGFLGLGGLDLNLLLSLIGLFAYRNKNKKTLYSASA